MQRIVKWTEDTMVRMPHVGGGEGRSSYDLDGGSVFAVDLDPATLRKFNPALLEAFTIDGRVGRIVSHTFKVDGSFRFWSFVVEA